MPSEITELFNNNNYTIVILTIFILMSAIIAIYDIVCKFSSIIGKPIGVIKQRNADHLMLLKTVDDLKELHEKHEESVKQSIRHDELIKQSVLSLTQKVDNLSKDILDFKTSNNNDKLAEYKDKIGQSYRFYNERKYSESNPIPYWNHMEKESLEGLIKQYEEHGGKNSFVHSIVEPEMQKWKVIN